MKEGISHQRGALYWKSFHIAHVNMQVEPHIQSTALHGRHMCVHTAAGGQDCILVVACFHSNTEVYDRHEMAHRPSGDR